jgi:hypothetical protein
MQTPLARRLTLVLAVIYAVLASLEVILRLSDPDFGAMAFLGGTLFVGSALMFAGLFGPVPQRFRVPVIMLGIVTGMIATLWTVVVPLLAITIVVLSIRGDGRTDVATRD